MRGAVDPYLQFVPRKFFSWTLITMRDQTLRIKFKCGRQPQHQFDENKHLLSHKTCVCDRNRKIPFHTNMNVLII